MFLCRQCPKNTSENAFLEGRGRKRRKNRLMRNNRAASRKQAARARNQNRKSRRKRKNRGIPSGKHRMGLYTRESRAFTTKQSIRSLCLWNDWGSGAFFYSEAKYEQQFQQSGVSTSFVIAPMATAVWGLVITLPHMLNEHIRWHREAIAALGGGW